MPKPTEPRTYLADPVGDEVYELSESPCWDAAAGRVRWVDILRATVLSARLDGQGVDDVERRSVPGAAAVGCVVPAADGGLLLAVDKGVVALRDDAFSQPLVLVPEPVAGRLNDGAVDPAGRFLVGSVPSDGARGQERLYRIEPDGTVTVLLEGLSLSNGLGWSPDGTTLYHADSTDGVVRAFDYPADGPLGPATVVVEPGVGIPDSLCVDTEGQLWVARWGGSEVHRHAPDGELTARITLPVPQPAGVAFVGPALDLLLITSGREHLSPAELAAFPLLGGLFSCDVGVSGVPTTPWQGSTSSPAWSS